MRYFHHLAARILQPPVLEKARTDGRKLVGFYCVMVPQELIAAHGALAIRLCGGFPVSEHSALPRDCCSLVTSSHGFLDNQNGFALADLDAVILPLVCDWKSRFAEALSPHLPILTLPVPFNKRESPAQKERLRTLSLMIRFLEEATGNTLSRKNLFQSIKTYQRANYATRRLMDCFLADQPAIRGSDLLLAMNLSFYDDITSWTDAVMQLATEAESVKQQGPQEEKKLLRLLLTGAPIIWPNWKLPEIIEEAGGSIVAEELCSGTRVFYDPVKLDEPTMRDMLRALADRYSLACTCPCFVPNDDRIHRNVSLAQRYCVDGVIYHNLRGCYLYHMESEAIAKKFKELNLPLLQIETDYSPEDTEQLTVRIEAFLEMLRNMNPRSD
jgi:benzoyl-CoA reductase/2-hydroxyglutaryl-CoA dehydratase subunit BcrC/BadD/HgdB